MSARHSKGTDVVVIAVVGMAVCCTMPVILSAVGGLGLASVIGGWLGAALGCLVLGIAAAILLAHRARCRGREHTAVFLPEPEQRPR